MIASEAVRSEPTFRWPPRAKSERIAISKAWSVARTAARRLYPFTARGCRSHRQSHVLADWKTLNIWRPGGGGTRSDDGRQVIKNMWPASSSTTTSGKRTVVSFASSERNWWRSRNQSGLFSITPITNPTSTVLFKCIVAIKTRNA